VEDLPRDLPTCARAPRLRLPASPVPAHPVSRESSPQTFQTVQVPLTSVPGVRLCGTYPTLAPFGPNLPKPPDVSRRFGEWHGPCYYPRQLIEASRLRHFLAQRSETFSEAPLERCLSLVSFLSLPLRFRLNLQI